MKQKLLYLASVTVVVSSSVLALMQVEDGTLMPKTNKLQSRNELGLGTEEVELRVTKLEKKYPHIDGDCLYASAMVMEDLADKIPTLLESESKCIHTIVISEGQEQHLQRQLAQ